MKRVYFVKRRLKQIIHHKNIYMHLLHNELTSLILKTYYKVYNELGYGFLEKVYQNALLIELKKKGLDVIPNKKIMVYYKGENVGDYYADIIVNNTVILELKAAEYIIDQFENQLLNYLKGTNCEIGLLLNFGKKPEFRRKIYENKRKNRKNQF